MGAAEEITHHLILIIKSSEAEIGELDAEGRRIFQEDVLRLNISMRNIQLVHVIESVEQLFCHTNYLQFGQWILLLL